VLREGERDDDAPGLLSGNPDVANKNETLPPHSWSFRDVFESNPKGLGPRVNIGERLSRTTNRKLTVRYQNGWRHSGDSG